MPRDMSEAERRFLLDGVAQGIRSDGRGVHELRRVTFEVGAVTSATGSCRLRAGDNDVLVGVKCDVSKPSRAAPSRGFFHIGVECAAPVSITFADNRDAEDMCRQLSGLLESLCAGDDVVDRSALCLLPGHFVWEVHADVLILASGGGNLLDSVSLALHAALRTTRLPKVEVQEAMEEGEVTQLKVDDRPEVGSPFPLRKLPVCVSVAQMGDQFVLDATPQEEACADGMLCVVLDGACGEVIGIHQLGRGLLGVPMLPAMIERCRLAAAAISLQLEPSFPPWQNC